MPVTGWRLSEADRARLLARFPPEWPDVIADHITLDTEADAADALPTEREAEIVGGVSDGNGLQALVVAIGGTTDRPDGSTYHITWSLDPSRCRKPTESNNVIADLGWRPLDNPVPIRIEPARWR